MSETERALEEERRIINAATPGAHWMSQGDENTAVYLGEGSGSDTMHAEFYSPDDATLYLHARTALPLRNAQVAKVLVYLDEMERLGDAATSLLASDIRRAIEEAGA